LLFSGTLRLFPLEINSAYLPDRNHRTNDTYQYLKAFCGCQVTEKTSFLFMTELFENVQTAINLVRFKFIRVCCSQIYNNITCFQIREILENFKSCSNGWLPNIFFLSPTSASENFPSKLISLIQETNCTIPLNAHVYFLICSDYLNQCHEAFEIYSIKSNIFYNKINNSKSSVETFLEDIVNGMVGRRKDFKQTPITGVTVEYQPFAQFQEVLVDGIPELRVIGGSTVHPFWFLRDALNFRSVRVRVSKLFWSC